MAYQNKKTVCNAIASLLDQQSSEPFEVLLVTSGPDGTAELVRRQFPQVQVIESESRLLPGGTRNAGVAVARGENIAFLAADCTAEPGWVEGRLGAHRAGWGAVAGAVVPARADSLVARCSHYLLFCARLPSRPAGKVRFPDPAAHGLSISRTILEKVGLFDPAVKVGEDSKVAAKLMELGVEILFDPGVKVSHTAPQTLPGLIQEQFRRGYLAGSASPHPSSADCASESLRGFATAVLRRLSFIRRCTSQWALPSDTSRIWALGPWLFIGTCANRAGWVHARRNSIRANSSGRVTSRDITPEEEPVMEGTPAG